jgi:demethylmenaquinone methyltransferase/2-methoxy-6-polyprenyl-1,4-benzoquinol methylase
MQRYYATLEPMTTLRDTIQTPEGKRRYVRTLFATIADRYDFITVALSYGRDRAWKRRLVNLVSPRSGERVLDLATGTGDIAFDVASRGARVTALDITPRMIELARAKPAAVGVGLLVGDMTALPFASGTFDAVTVGYGLRNVSDLGAAIDELFRVVRSGGRVASLDFNRPTNPVIRNAYLAYLIVVGGALGWVLHRDPDTYRYIPASLRNYPGADGVSRMMTERGFVGVTHHPVLGGLMSIHFASRT